MPFYAMVLYGLSVAALGVSGYQDAYDYLFAGCLDQIR